MAARWMSGLLTGRGRALIAVAVAAMLVPAAAAHAATIPVTTTLDETTQDGDCSLREAVLAANADTAGPGGDCVSGSGADTIRVPSGNYTLGTAPSGSDDATTGDLNVTAPATIVGSGSAVTVDGGTLDRVFDVQSKDVHISDLEITNGHAPSAQPLGGDILVTSGGALTVDHSVVTNGYAAKTGGAIDNQGTLELTNSEVSDSNTTAFGGGIANSATLTIDASTVMLNGGAANGGGIYDDGSSLTVTSTTISGNSTSAQGGGIESTTPATLTGDNITDNNGSGSGAGIYAGAGLTLQRSTVANNTLSSQDMNQLQGGGIYAGAAATITDSWIHDNGALDSKGGGLGGGIYYAPGSANQLLDLEGSTIGPNNDAAGGDGIELTSGGTAATTADITRSTIAGNGADTTGGLGGGVAVQAGVSANLRDVTLAQNQASPSTGGGNLYVASDSALTFANTLVAQPFGGGNCELGTPAPAISSLGGDQEYGDPQQVCGFTNAAHGDVHTSAGLTSSQLMSLADNGGPTETMALGAGAPPVDTGSDCRSTDQRGVTRPQGSACDSGAYERALSATTVPTPSGPAGTTYAPGGGTASPPQAPGVVAALLSRASESASTWREGNALVRISGVRRPPVGTTFRFGLDMPAAIHFYFTQALTGRKIGRRCVAPRKRNRRHRTCSRRVIRGALSFGGHAGLNVVHFAGRLSRSKRLKPGRYTLIIRALTPGAGSTAAVLTFRIVR